MSIIRDGFQSADLDVPVVLPTLNLDFANSQELDPRITFSRGSPATFVNKNGLIETVAANTPRFDYDPISGECRGLLIEESRTNRWLNSGQSNVTAWNTGGVNLSFDNTVTAPDGTTNTIKCVETNTFTSGKNINQSISVTSGTSYTFSIFAKQPENSPLRYFSILFWNTGFTTFQIVTFDPKNGTVLSNPSGNTTFVQKYPNGWWRFGVTATATATAAVPFNIRFTNSLSSSANPPYGLGGPYGNYTGDGSSFLYFYGPQVENGAFMTSFIPTDNTSGGITRNPDNASMTGTNFSSWYNQTESTIFCKFNAYNLMSSSFTGVFQIRGPEPSGLNRVELLLNGPGGQPIYHNLYQNGPNFAEYFGFTYTTGPTKNIMRYKDLDTFVASKDGNIRKPTSTPRARTIPLTKTMDTLNIGRVTNYLNGAISRFTYYPRALNDAEIQYLTQ